MPATIELTAGAIDSKSAYTGGHCQRVPVLTEMLAKAAIDSKEGLFKDFTLNEDQWEELHIAAWLHDCGAVADGGQSRGIGAGRITRVRRRLGPGVGIL